MSDYSFSDYGIVVPGKKPISEGFFISCSAFFLFFYNFFLNIFCYELKAKNLSIWFNFNNVFGDVGKSGIRKKEYFLLSWYSHCLFLWPFLVASIIVLFIL